MTTTHVTRPVTSFIVLALTWSLCGTAIADPVPDEPAQKRPANATPPPPALDLFPSQVLGSIADREAAMGPRQKRAEKERPVIRFDTGDGWKGDAAMAGAMVGAFAALAAICSGGACMLR